MFWNKDVETLDRESLNELQLDRLQKAVKAAYNTPFYRKVFEANGISPNDIKSLADISKIPFTTKQDLRHSYPDGMVAVEKDNIVRMHASSGTTGKSTVIFYTQKDIDAWALIQRLFILHRVMLCIWLKLLKNKESIHMI